MPQPEPPPLVEAQVVDFVRQGFVVIPDAVPAEGVAALKQWIERDREANGGAWELRGMDHHARGGGLVGERGRWQVMI
jgi:hypothetical protein